MKENCVQKRIVDAANAIIGGKYNLVQYKKPDGTPFNAVTIETPESIYLVKIKLKTDDAEALERWLEGEEDAENEEVAGASADAAAESTLPDDNISQYGGDDGGDDA